MTTAPALAGTGNGGSTTTRSSIAIATIDGATMAAAATASPTPALGDALTFATTGAVPTSSSLG
jgi:hypothetical protein